MIVFSSFFEAIEIRNHTSDWWMLASGNDPLRGRVTVLSALFNQLLIIANKTDSERLRLTWYSKLVRPTVPRGMDSTSSSWLDL